jgi:hypothetical protein
MLPIAICPRIWRLTAPSIHRVAAGVERMYGASHASTSRRTMTARGIHSQRRRLRRRGGAVGADGEPAAGGLEAGRAESFIMKLP